MLRRWQTLFWSALLGGICLAAAIGLPKNARDTSSQTVPRIPSPNRRLRSLTLQPDAAKLARAVGKRFAADKKTQSVLTGSMIFNGLSHTISMIRQQRDDGEQVIIYLDGSQSPLKWAADTGAVSGSERATAAEREFVERVVADSPDQFVLSQLRGASYFTVAQNVRPAEANDGYEGPLWNVVRVNDRGRDETTKVGSSWRLYYLNVSSGLIDRIISETGGETIEAQLSAWTNYQGELMPAQIVWRRGPTVIMEFRLNNFVYSELDALIQN